MRTNTGLWSESRTALRRVDEQGTGSVNVRKDKGHDLSYDCKVSKIGTVL